MLRSILVALILGFAVQANAMFKLDLKSNIDFFQKHAQTQAVGPLALPWVVGETANYNIKMAVFNGTMVMEVKEDTGDAFWVHQQMDIIGQKNLVEMLFDKETGEVREIIVNGKKEDLPEEGAEPEIVDQREEAVTVPAGTFDSIYVKLLNDGQESEMWVNPIDVPIFGLLKQLSPSQFGQVTLELTSFKDL